MNCSYFKMEKVTEYIKESINVKNKLLAFMPEKIHEASELIKGSLSKGNKILVAGNGGSASDSQHFAAELVGRYKKERNALASIALTTDTSIITAISNDYDYNTIFKRQIQALGKAGDIFIAISTSGNSKNLIEGIKVCKEMGIRTIGLLGNDGGKLKDIVDYPMIVPSNNTPRIQEAHIMIIHIICELVEEGL